MEDWRGDLLKIGIIPDDMPDQTNFVLFNLDELNDLIKEIIQQELSKAREETRQEERDMFIVRHATVSFNEVIKTIKTLSIIEFLSIKWGLKGKKKSKLTTK